MELESSGTLEDSVEANEALRLLQTYSSGTASQKPPVGTTSFGAATRWPVTMGALRVAEAVATGAQVPQQRSSSPAASEDMAGAAAANGPAERHYVQAVRTQPSAPAALTGGISSAADAGEGAGTSPETSPKKKKGKNHGAKNTPGHQRKRVLAARREKKRR